MDRTAGWVGSVTAFVGRVGSGNFDPRATLGRPRRRNSVLEELRVKRLAVIQEDICWREC